MVITRPQTPARTPFLRGTGLFARGPNLAALTCWGLAMVVLAPLAGSQYVLKTHSDLVLVPINVLDKHGGLPVRGLKKADFQLSVDGASVPIAFFQQGSSSDLPLALAVILDLRGIQRAQRGKVASTFQDGSWREWLNEIPSQDLIAVLRAGNQSEVLQDYTSDRTLTRRAFMGLAAKVKIEKIVEKRPTGGSEIDTEVDQAIRLAASRAQAFDGRYVKQTVVITGDVNVVEKSESEQVLRFLQSQDIILNAVLVENLRARMARGLSTRAAALQTRAYKTPFVAKIGELYAEGTGGLVVKSSPAQVPEAVLRLFKTLDEGYVAAFVPPPGTAHDQRHSITVAVTRFEDRVEVTYRQGFYLSPSDLQQHLQGSPSSADR